MRDIVISKRYASALYGSLNSLDQKKRIIEDLQKLRSCLDSSEELSRLIKNPIVKKSDKIKAVMAIVEYLNLSETVRDFLLLLINKNRLSLFGGIYNAVVEFYNEEIGVTEADLVLASPISDSLVKDIESVLSKVSGKKVIANIRINSNIIGGFAAKVKSNLYDASIKGQLDKLSEKMLEI